MANISKFIFIIMKQWIKILNLIEIQNVDDYENEKKKLYNILMGWKTPLDGSDNTRKSNVNINQLIKN